MTITRAPKAAPSPEAAAATSPLPQFTLRAVVTGMVLGGVLSLCNIYSGLKIGWGFNMSITAALLSYGLYSALRSAFGTRQWNLLENNVNQTAASAGASISSAGLVAPIPALTMITGQELSYPVLALWVLSVGVMGVVVAIGLRRQMVEVDALPFPNGVATAETLKEMYARGKEAIARVLMLVGGAAAAAALKVVVTVAKIGHAAIPGTFTAAPGGALAAKGVGSVSLKNLTFSLDPSVLMVGVGALIGFRAAWSMLLGAVLAWGIAGPELLDAGLASPALLADGAVKVDGSWFGTMIKWLLWPGVALMITASLTSFAFSWRSVGRAIFSARHSRDGAASDGTDLKRSTFLRMALVAMLASVVLQSAIFGIGWGIALFGVLLTVLLAIVAARVSGETGITPVGPMGKVTQLAFGALDPGNATANLMAANVTGGAASQCADLLHDMKTGAMIGAAPRYLAFAQLFGVLAGAVVGSAAYLILVPDPQKMLLTDEWAAPAVAQWKAVAELFKDGIQAMPKGAVDGILIGAGIGFVLAVLEKLAKPRWRRFIPSPTAMGIAVVVPANYAISTFFGGLAAVLLGRVAPRWSARFLIVLAAGLIAGESLTGVVIAISTILGGG
ncbi:MAG: OPT family oligopeptide transporter [Deltaproteobacteria bacterium]|nr:MAG: OPT family oligopeptide transporter [Deltaproteobacteria bacterium]